MYVQEIFTEKNIRSVANIIFGVNVALILIDSSVFIEVKLFNMSKFTRYQALEQITKSIKWNEARITR